MNAAKDLDRHMAALRFAMPPTTNTLNTYLEVGASIEVRCEP